jgi:copper(I)-binding protein
VGLLSSAVKAGDPGPLELEDAWVRALPPTQKVTAAYLKVVNRGTAPAVITGGEAELAAEVQIHTTREIDGYMRMERLPELEVPAGGSAVLEPGATHLMLMQLERMPAAGEQLRLCLTLASGQSACTMAAVRKSARVDGSHAHHH